MCGAAPGCAHARAKRRAGPRGLQPPLRPLRLPLAAVKARDSRFHGLRTR